MNLLMNLSEAMQSTIQMERESHSIVGLCSEIQKTEVKRNKDYTAFLRRRNRFRRAA
jgi:hypothetical protein